MRMEERLRQMFGVYGPAMKRATWGIDVRPSLLFARRSTVGHATTLPYNLTDEDQIRQVFLNLADQVCRRMRKKGWLADSLANYDSRSVHEDDYAGDQIARATDHADEVHREACRLFSARWPAGKPVRLLGITLSGLVPKNEAPLQLDLFEYEKEPKKERLVRTMDEIRDKFGESSLLTAGMLSNDPSSLIRDRKRRGTSLERDDL